MQRLVKTTSRHVLVALVLAVALSACGKKGPPKPPEGEEVTYPRTYPTR
ncbi:MAG: lipoprotein [Alphaproteobacteria bacterium]